MTVSDFLYPVRALLRRMQRLVAIMTSAVVESALIVIVSGEICKSCRYVWSYNERMTQAVPDPAVAKIKNNISDGRK